MSDDNRTVSSDTLPVAVLEPLPTVTANSGTNRGLANLRPWQPGQSGNPSGYPASKRPKPLTDALAKALTPEVCEQIAKEMVKKMVKASVPHFNEVANRIEGKPADSEGTGSVTIQVVLDLPRPRHNDD